MAREIRIWAVQIITKTTLATDATIGMYSVSGGNSELRWSPVALAGVAETWATGILAEDWCGDITNRADTRRGGTRAIVDTLKITISNHNQLHLRLKEKSIYLGGCEIKIIEFLGSESNNDAVSRIVRYTGNIDNIDYNEMYGEITASPVSQKRRANLAKEIGPENYPNAVTNVGKIVPITFGNHDKAKLLKTADKDTVFTTAFTQVMNHSIPLTLVLPNRTDVDIPSYGYSFFPVVGIVGTSPSLQYIIQLCPEEAFASWEKTGSREGSYDLTVLHGRYIRVVDGTSAGVYRKIEKATVVLSTSEVWPVAYGKRKIVLTVADYFQEALSFNETATAENNSWIEIINIENSTDLDFWPCYGFIDENNLNTTAPNLYTYTSDKYVPMGQYGYSVDVSANNNKLAVDLKHFTDTPNDLDSFSIFLPESVDFIENGINLWLNNFYSYHAHRGDGFYTNTTGITCSFLGPLSNVLDKNKSTFAQWEIYGNPTSSQPMFAVAIKIVPPQLPNGFEYDSVYLGIKADMPSIGLDSDVSAFVKYRFFMGGAKDVWKISGGPEPEQNSFIVLDSIPDFYYNTSTDTKNKNFYITKNASIEGNVASWTGYETFEIEGLPSLKNRQSAWNSMREMVLIYYTNVYSPSPWGATIKVSEICFIFKMASTSIGDGVFAGNAHGRVYNSTWEERKYPLALIQKPQDILEHILRLQDFGDTSKNPGKEYPVSPTASILSGDEYGGFDNSTAFTPTGLADYRLLNTSDLVFARQIMNKEEAHTDTMAKSLCEEAFFVNYQDATGKECVKYLFEKLADGFVYTKDHMLSYGKLIDPNISDIYCTLEVKYNYDHGKGDYLNKLSINRVNQSLWTFDVSYTEGFLNTVEAQRMWSIFRNLYIKYGQLETPPNGSVSLKWIKTYKEACWWMYHYAKWCDKYRMSIVFPYLVGRSFEIGTEVNIQLPHLTNNKSITCMIEAVSKNATKNRVSTTVVLIDEIDSGLYSVLKNYQDSNATKPKSILNWQDNDELYEDRNDTGLEDVQDSDTLDS